MSQPLPDIRHLGAIVPQLSLSVPPLQLSCHRCYRGAVPAAGRRRGHRDDLLTLWRLDAGSGRLRWQEGLVHLSSQNWLVVPPGLRRDQDFSPDARLYSLGLRCDHRAGISPWKDPQPFSFQSADLDRSIDALARACASLGDVDAAGSRPAAWGLLGALGQLAHHLMQLLEDRWQPAAWQHLDQRLVRLLSAGLRHYRIDWAFWQGETGCTRRQLDRLAVRQLGRPVMAWLTEQRLARACGLLRDAPEMLLKQVAAEVGFVTAAEFSRWFHSHSGSSPRTWRRTAQQV